MRDGPGIRGVQAALAQKASAQPGKRCQHRHEVADSLDAIARSLEGSDQSCFRVAALVARCFIEKTPQCRVGGRRDEHPASRDGRLVHAPQRIYCVVEMFDDVEGADRG